MSLLDVGCGPGTITLDLARLVAPGRVVGVDSSAEVLDMARHYLDDAGLDNVELRMAQAEALPFEARSFDVVHTHQLLQHVGDPVAAIAEMRRVCAPGGLVAAREVDFSTMTWWPSDPLLDRWLELYCRVHRANGGEPNAGRRLRSWALAAGFEHVTSSASAWCFATPEERLWWSSIWAERLTESAVTGQILSAGLATEADLRAIADAWRDWAASPDGWYAMINGEILCEQPHLAHTAG